MVGITRRLAHGELIRSTKCAEAVGLHHGSITAKAFTESLQTISRRRMLDSNEIHGLLGGKAARSTSREIECKVPSNFGRYLPPIV